MSWMEYKLLTGEEVSAEAPPLPASNSLGGDVYVCLSQDDGTQLLVAGKVIAVDFTAAKVRYSVAFPVSPQPRIGITMYAVVENIPSEMVTANLAGAMSPSLDSVGEDLFTQIESAANQGALGNNSLPEPTVAQKLASNYQVGRAMLHGMDIAIEQPRGTIRSGVNEKTGVAWSNRMAAHYGYLSGTIGADGDELDIFVGPYPESTAAYVINQVDPESGDFDEHKIMLGMLDQGQAISAYQNSYDKGWKGLSTVVPATVGQINAWARTGNTRIPLTVEAIQNQGYDNMTPVTWTGEQPNAATIDGVLYDIRRHDPDGLLLDSVSIGEVMDDADGTETLDALVTPFVKLPRKMEQLQAVMERVSDAVKPVAMQITAPFKQRGAANVATIFELSDGQTLTIFFHNPDATPAKILSTDELISWKWMLNKKDITIVAAPEHGSDLSIRTVASRIMRLAAKNSPAFQRANSQRAERLQRIAALKDSVAAKEVQLASLQKMLEVRKIERETMPAAIAAPAAPPESAVDAAPRRADVPAVVVPDPIEAAIVAGAVAPSLVSDTQPEETPGAPGTDPLPDPVAGAVATGEVVPALITDPSTEPVEDPPAAAPLDDPIAEAEAVGAVAADIAPSDTAPSEAVGLAPAMLAEDPLPAVAPTVSDPIAAAEAAGAVSEALLAGPEGDPVAVDPAAAAVRADDAAFIQSVIDGQADIWDAELAGRLEAVIGRIQDDQDLVGKWNQAITAYTNAMMRAASERLVTA